MRAFTIYKLAFGIVAMFGILNSLSDAKVIAQQTKYTVTELPTLGGPRSTAFSINNSNQVVGNAETASRQVHAVLYESGTVIDLGTLGGNDSYAYHISDSCIIVGRSQNSKGLYRPFVTSCAVDSPLVDLGTLNPLLDGSYSTASSVNTAGEVVGYTAVAARGHQGGRRGSFVFSNNRVVDLGTFGGEESIVTGINDAGQIVGYVSNAPHGTYADHRGFLYGNGKITELGTLGGKLTTPVAINSSGKVVGYSETTGAVPHAFIYSDGLLKDLGTLPGGNQSLGFGINNEDQVVGAADNRGTLHAFLYSKGVMQDLNDLIPSQSGWILTEARSINESGQIVGNGILKGQERAFLLTPIGVAGANKATRLTRTQIAASRLTYDPRRAGNVTHRR